MNVLIVINATDIGPKMFANAVSQKGAWINDEETTVNIVDLCDIETGKKYMTWLKRTKKEGKIILSDIFDYADPYDIVLVIGGHHDLRNFRNSVTIVNYRLKLTTEVKEKDEVWN